MKKLLSILLIVLLFPFSYITNETTAAVNGLPKNVVIGYWENWGKEGQNKIKLRDCDRGWDVVIVSFMLTDETNYRCVFSPVDYIYGSNVATAEAEFLSDVKFLQSRGQKVLIAFGGAVSYNLDLRTTANRDEFYRTARDIIEKYDFDGWDIDIEQSILANKPAWGDYATTCIDKTNETSMLNPTKPTNVNLIWICKELEKYFGDDFMLTMAPEHPYVQGGAFYWGGSAGIWGGYLPLINGVRDILDFVHVQLYNNGYGDYPDGYNIANVESYVNLTKLLIEGFTTGQTMWQPGVSEYFAGLRPDQVALGVLVQNTGGSGTLTNAEYAECLRQLLAVYPDFRGIMTWSINWTVYNKTDFLPLMRSIIDELPVETTTTVSILIPTMTIATTTSTATTPILTTISAPPIENNIGDIDLDNQVGKIADVVLLGKHVASKISLTGQSFINANCDMRDPAVNVADLQALIKYMLKQISELPFKG
ncbi:chitinase [Clostridia bacterium]|nr:chitinase [Clostridia bacterium]